MIRIGIYNQVLNITETQNINKKPNSNKRIRFAPSPLSGEESAENQRPLMLHRRLKTTIENGTKPGAKHSDLSLIVDKSNNFNESSTSESLTDSLSRNSKSADGDVQRSKEADSKKPKKSR